MVMIAFVLVVIIAVAAFCAVRLTRTPAGEAAPIPVPDVASMKVALERRAREGADFSL